MRMRPFVLAAVLLMPAVAGAQPSEALAQGYMLLYKGEPEEAQAHFGRLRVSHKDALGAWFGSLFVTMARLDYDDGLAPALEEGVDALIDAASARYGRSTQDVEALYYLAQAYLLRSTYRLNFDKGMWGAARDAAKSKNFSEAYIKRHPEHGDAYLALGLYNYYVDIAPSFVKVLRVLLLLPAANRAEGLRQLERAAASGQMFAPFAETALAGIYGSFEGQLEVAIPRAERLVRRFPGNAEMRMELAALYLHPAVEDFGRAEEHYMAVRQRAAGGHARHVSQRHSAILGLASVRRNQWRIEEAAALLTPLINTAPGKPQWILPTLLLRRANYRTLLNDAAGVEDARRVLKDATLEKWHEDAERQMAAAEARRKGPEGQVYAALIPGNRLVAQDRFEEATRLYADVGRRYPGDPQVQYRMAYLAFARGRYAEAAAGMQAIADTRAAVPDWLKAAALLHLAWTHDVQGRRAEALPLYKRVVDRYEHEAAASAARLGLIAAYRGPIVVAR